MNSWLRFLLVAAFLFVSAQASATPVTYGLTTGTITVQANQSSDQELIFNQTLELDLSSYIVWDSAGIPDVYFPSFGLIAGTLNDFSLSIAPSGLPHALENGAEYGPFNMITVESGLIAPEATGYSTKSTQTLGSSFVTVVGGVDITAFYSAFHSVTLASTPGPIEADIATPNDMSATISFNAGVIQVSMDSIVMGSVDGAPFGEAGNDLILTANINFFGDSNVTPVPEPSTGLLLAMGLVAMTAARRDRTIR